MAPPIRSASAESLFGAIVRNDVRLETFSKGPRIASGSGLEFLAASDRTVTGFVWSLSAGVDGGEPRERPGTDTLQVDLKRTWNVKFVTNRNSLCLLSEYCRLSSFGWEEVHLREWTS